jgi:flagellar secretion chaperone FliS
MLDTAARENYLATQVLTASPAKLQLLLLEGAIRHGRHAGDQWRTGNQEAAWQSLVRCRQIVTELLCGVKFDGTELTRRVRSVYGFVFRTLTEAQLERNEEKLDDALRILELERETWREVCERHVNSTPTPVAVSIEARSSESLSVHA